MRNIIVILALFVCTSICLGDPRQTININGNIGEWDVVRARAEREVEFNDEREQREAKWNEEQRQQRERQQQLERWQQQRLVKWNKVCEQEMEMVWQSDNLRNIRDQFPNLDMKWQSDNLLNIRDQYLSQCLKKLEREQREWQQREEEHRQWEQRQREQLFTEWNVARIYYPDIAGNGNPDLESANYGKALDGGVWNNPNDNRLIINSGAKVGDAYGAYMNKVSVVKNVAFRSMTNNEVIVNGGEFGCGHTNGYIVGARADDDIADLMNVSSNTVRITGGSNIHDVFGGRAIAGIVSSNTVTISSSVTIEQRVCGGYIHRKGTATGNRVELTDVFVKQDVFGALTRSGYASSNTVTIKGGIIGAEDKKGEVYGGYIKENGTVSSNTVNLTSVTVTNNVIGGAIGKDGYASSNTVTIKGGKIEGEVHGVYIRENGTATLNKVNLTSVTVTKDVCGAVIFGSGIGIRYASSNTVTITSGTVHDVYGAWIENGLASSNTVTIKGGKIEGEVYGGYIKRNGTATLNAVNLTSVTVTKDVCGGKIGIDVFGIVKFGSGLASSNTVTIISGTVKNVYGGYIVKDGTATGNTVTINGGKTGGNVFGGYVDGNGKAIYNTITITGSSEQSSELSSPEFSTATILCGGICRNVRTNDAFTGNTLNIETKGVVVKGISNFEKYNFHLKDIKPGEVILTATSGGCSWDVVRKDYTPACAVDLLRSNIHLRTKGVLNKRDYYTLIKSPRGFKDNVVKAEQFEFENEGLLVKYYWDIKIADNGRDLIAKLTDKRIRDEGVAKSLSEGYGAGVVCTNNGMDCVLSKMEETESVLGERKGEIGVFCGLAANKSSYNKELHIDMIGMSMMGGVGIRVEVGEKEFSSKKLSSLEQSSELTVGAFGECGTGNSDIDSGLCPCEKKSEGKSKYVGGGVLGKCNIYEDEFSGTKLYVEAILRAGQVSNSFKSKEAKDSTGKEYEYDDEPVMYGGCALGGGYKHKVSEKIDLDWSLRYMFGYQGGKDVKRVDADGNKVKFESVKSSRIRVGVRGKYVDLEKVKPYIEIGYEHELSGEVKGAMQNGVDRVGDMPATSFEGGTGIGELGISVKVGKLDVGISGQEYVGVRKGFGGMLKLKYAFGNDTRNQKTSKKETVELEKSTHAKPQPKDKKKETTESKGRRSLKKLKRNWS